MSERTPKLNTIRQAWVKAHPFPLTTDVEERYAEFDRALAVHDAEVRAAALAEQGDPAKDERLACYMAMVTPLGYQSALTVVQQMTALIDAETRARALAEQGEQEWEYGNEMLMNNHTQIYPASSEFMAKAQAWLWPMYRRRKAGPWLPVPDTTGDKS